MGVDVPGEEAQLAAASEMTASAQTATVERSTSEPAPLRSLIIRAKGESEESKLRRV